MSYQREWGDRDWDEDRYDSDDGRWDEGWDGRCQHCRTPRVFHRTPYIRYFRRPHSVYGKKYIPSRCCGSFYNR